MSIKSKKHIALPKKSPRRLFSSETLAEIQKLGELLKNEVDSHFSIGDQITLLVEKKKVKIKVLAQIFNRKSNRLSEIYRTSLIFGKKERDLSIPFTSFDNARRAAKKFKLSPQQALKLIKKHKLSQRRDVTRFFAERDQQRDRKQAARQALTHWDKRDNILDNCHHCDCRELIPKIKRNFIKIAVVDAPYGRFNDYKDGQYYSCGVTQQQCDNPTSAEVVDLLDDVLRLLKSKMAPGGVLLLFRPGGIVDPLHADITQAANQYGWEIPHQITWDKKKVKLGNSKSPYSVRTERIWVLNRAGDTLIDHDGSSRSDVVCFSPVSQRIGHSDDSHLFSKPQELCSFLIQKHSYEGEVIFDACGCSGNFCISAFNLNRHFIYCESNKDNYQLGSRRIYKATEANKERVG